MSWRCFFVVIQEAKMNWSPFNKIPFSFKQLTNLWRVDTLFIQVVMRWNTDVSLYLHGVMTSSGFIPLSFILNQR